MKAVYKLYPVSLHAIETKTLKEHNCYAYSPKNTDTTRKKERTADAPTGNTVKTWFKALYTVSQKVPTFKLSVALSNLNRFSKFLHCWKAYEICYDIIHLTLGMLLHYLGKLKFQIFCRCGRKRKQIAFLIAYNFVIHPQILIFSVFKIASLSPYWL